MEETTLGRSIKIPANAIIKKQLGQFPIDEENYKLVFQVGACVATLTVSPEFLEELQAGKEITFFTDPKCHQ